MDIKELARQAFTEQDIIDMFANIMIFAKEGSLRHADFILKVITYEPKADNKGQLQIPFEEVTLKIFHNGTQNNSN